MATNTLETTTVGQRMRETAAIVDGLDLPDSTHVSVNTIRYSGGHGRIDMHVHCSTIEDLRHVRRAVGRVEKKTTSASIGMVLRGEVQGIQITLWPPAGTCKQIQVGTETVDREVPTSTETVTETVPVYEWDCGDVLRDEHEAVA